MKHLRFVTSKFSETVRGVLPPLRSLYAAVIVSSRPVILTSVTVTALLIGVRQLGLLQAHELRALDQLVRLRPDAAPDQRLLVVAVTEADIQAQKQWPLPDRTLAQLLAKLEQYQPRVIGLDIYRDLPVEPGHTQLTQRLQQSDRIITVCQVSDAAGNPGIAPPPGIPTSRVGFSDLLIDAGGILRRSLLFVNPPSTKQLTGQKPHLCQDATADIFSFSLQLALHYLAAANIKPELTSSNELKLGSTVFSRLQANSGGYQNIDTAGYQILLNYRALRQVAQQVSLTDVLSGKVNPDWVKDRIVLIGTTAESIKDNFYTPYSAAQQSNQKMPGVVIHAQATSQILSAVLDRRPLLWYWSSWSEVLWIGIWSLAGGTLAWQIRHPLRFGLSGVAALGGLFVICYGCLVWGGWIPFVPPALAMMATAGSVVLVDRFNKAGYTQTIYNRVKGALKINVEIDHSKKARQVAEITESDYFQHLQKKGKELRSKKPKVLDSEVPTQTDQTTTQPTPQCSESEYIRQMQDKVKRLKQRGNQADK